MAHPIEVVELERTKRSGIAVSASEVRRLLAGGNHEKIREFVPKPTFDLIMEKYATSV